MRPQCSQAGGGASFHEAGLIPLKAPAQVKTGQIALWFAIYRCWNVLGPAKVKRFLLVLRLLVTRPRSLSKKPLKSRRRRDVPMGLRSLQEKQSCGQLLSTLLEGLDKPGQPTAV